MDGLRSSIAPPAAAAATAANAPAFTGTAAAIALHALIGAASVDHPIVATAHAAAALIISLWIAARKRPALVACAVAYLACSEVFWRVVGARAPYEFGKYSISLVCLVGLFKLGRAARWRWLPVLYFAALLPSIVVLLSELDFELRPAIMRLSFNLSGPLCLCMSVWYFSQIRLSRGEMGRVFATAAVAACSLAAVTLVSTVTADELNFNNESNVATSGGFGPNQVSASLGFGAFAAFLFAVATSVNRRTRALALFAMLWIGVQGALTFSRGGLFGGIGAIAIVGIFLLLDRRTRGTTILVGAVLVLVVGLSVAPRLNEFTGGALSSRLTDLAPTNREVLVKDDLRLVNENPILGVGPGGAGLRRIGVEGSGHTEFTRLLAEHGSFGVLALLLLVLMALRAVLRNGTPLAHGLRLALVAWSLFSMGHAAMRIAAFSLAFGLAHADFDADDEPGRESIDRGGDDGRWTLHALSRGAA